MKKFILLVLKFTLPPVVCVLALYVWLDPFKVVKHYDTYFESGSPTNISLNKEYVSTANLENRYAQEQYNSFIFGNSRSMVYETDQWKQHLPPNARPYHFDSFGGTLFGLYKKLQYLDDNNIAIDNALFVLDYRQLALTEPAEDYLFATAPQLVNNRNFISFHTTFLSRFLSYKFLFPYLQHKVTGKITPYMKSDFFIQPITYNVVTNELHHTYLEQLIAQGNYYSGKQMVHFYKRDTFQKYYQPCIKHTQKKMLQQIASILKKRHCCYKIVLSPIYNQLKLSNADLAYLKQLFGSETVYDFSGINAITNDYTNYYEDSHYRHKIARQIIDSIYRR